MDLNKIQPIIEGYTCIQTEGSKAGFPHFLIRTTGCTHRCWFGEGGWCDSWYSSIEPEKGSFSLQDIKTLFEKNPHIKYLMISGGSPTMHPQLLEDLTTLFAECRTAYQGYDDGFITLETEGSHFVKTTRRIDLISLSPKFENSVPKLGVKFPNSDKVVDQKLIYQHNKFRGLFSAMRQMIDYHKDYHLKPVVNKEDLTIWEEIKEVADQLDIPADKIWLMPAGSTRKEVIPNYGYVMDQARDRGYNFSGRAHIIAFDDKRGV